MAVSAAELKVILSATDNMSGTLKSAGSSLGALESGALNAGKALLAVGATAAIGGIAALAGGLGFAVKAAADFESQMSAISAVSGASASQMNDLRGMVLQLGADTSFSAIEAGQGVEELIKAGVSVADVMGGAAAASLNLAAAGAISVGEAATITSNSLNAFGKSGAEAGHVADVIAGAANASAIDVHEFGFSLAAVGAVAHAVGASFDDTATAIAVLGQAGIKGSDAGTSLKTTLLSLHPVTDKQIALFDQLGITTKGMGNKFYDAQGNFAGVANMAQVLQEATKGMTREQKLATLEMIGGTDAVRALSILMDQGAEGVNKMAESIAGISAADVANERLNNLSGSLEKMKGSLSTAAIAVGTAFLPNLRALADTVTAFINDHLPQIEAFAQGMADAFNGIDFSGIVNVLGSVFGPALTTAKEAWQTFVQALQGDWAPDATQIAPFTNAVGIAAVNMRELALAIANFNTEAAKPGSAASDLKIAFENIGLAADKASHALDGFSVQSGASTGHFYSDAEVIKIATAWLVGLAEAFRIAAQVAVTAGSAIAQQFQGIAKAMSGDLAGGIADFQAGFHKFEEIGPIMDTAGERVRAAIQDNMLPHLKMVPIAADEMLAAMERDVVQMATETDANLGVKIPQTVQDMADAVNRDMDIFGLAGVTGVAAFTDSVTTGMEEATVAAETGAAAISESVAPAMEALPPVADAAMAAFAASVDTGGAAAATAAITESQALVDGAGAIIATMPAVAEAGLGPVPGVAMAVGQETTAQFDAAIASIPSDTSATMGQVSGAVAAESGPAGGSAASVGISIVEGLRGAIQGGIASVAAAASALVSSAISAARAAADAHSPSKATYDLGTDLVDGLRNGLGTGDGLFDQIIGQFRDFITAASDYRSVAETILRIEQDTKSFRESAQLDAIRREWEMVDVVSEELRLKRDLVAAERDLLPARQAAANAERQISDITRGTLGQRQDLILIDAARNKIKLQQLDLEEKLIGLKSDDAAAKAIKIQLDGLRDQDKLLSNQAERIRINNDLQATSARVQREVLIDAVRNGEQALIPTQQMIALLESEINVWKADEAVVSNVTKNFVNSQALRIAALKDESLATAERINAGTALVDKLTAEGLISTTTAGKLRDLAAAALTGKGSSGEFFAAINLLITAMGGEAGAAGAATEKTAALASTISTTGAPAVAALGSAAATTAVTFDGHMSPAVDNAALAISGVLTPAAAGAASVFDDHMSPAVDNAALVLVSALDPALSAVASTLTDGVTPATDAQTLAVLAAIQKDGEWVDAVHAFEQQMGRTQTATEDVTGAIQTLNDTPPTIPTEGIDAATASMKKATSQAQKLAAALANLDKNTSSNAKAAFAKGTSANNTNVNPDFQALGGRVLGGSLNIVGEKGPELFVPGSNGTIIPHSEMAAVMSGASGGSTDRAPNITIQVNAPIYGVNDMEDVVIRALDRAGRRGRT